MHEYEKNRIKKFLHYAWKIWTGLCIGITAFSTFGILYILNEQNIRQQTTEKTPITTQKKKFQDLDGNGKIDQWEYREQQ